MAMWGVRRPLQGQAAGQTSILTETSTGENHCNSIGEIHQFPVMVTKIGWGFPELIEGKK